MEAQILEFGQTPKQLFTSPHPQKLVTQVVIMISDESLHCSQSTVLGINFQVVATASNPSSAAEESSVVNGTNESVEANNEGDVPGPSESGKL